MSTNLLPFDLGIAKTAYGAMERLQDFRTAVNNLWEDAFHSVMAMRLEKEHLCKENPKSAYIYEREFLEKLTNISLILNACRDLKMAIAKPMGNIMDDCKDVFNLYNYRGRRK